MRFLAVFALTFAILFTPLLVSANSLIPAQLVPQCGGTENSPYCQACHLMQLVQNLINFAVFAAAVVATLMFVYAGFLYVTAASAGQDQLKKARGIFVKVFMGFVIILVAWLVVDLIMKTFLDTRKFGPWNEIDCVAFQRVPVIAGSGGLGTSGGAATTTVGIRFASDQILRQYEQGHASPELNALVGCMTQRTSFTITSISDSLIANGSRSWAECRQGLCQHSAGSWHYGGTTGNNLSYAIDVRTRDLDARQRASLDNAARLCGATVLIESTHRHIQVTPR